MVKPKISTFWNGYMFYTHFGQKSSKQISEMPNWSRLVVCFDTVPDMDKVYESLRLSYRIGYCGLYKQLDDTFCIYIQTVSKQFRMVPSRVLLVCQPFGASALPTTFKSREGIFLAEKGEFRDVGAPKGPRKKISSGIDTTVNNINTANIRNGDQINREINIHLNALGSEDVSHIGMEQFKSLFEGSADDIIRQMKQTMSPEQYSNCVETAWEEVWNDLYTKKCSEEAMEDARGAASSGSAKEKTALQDRVLDDGPGYDKIILNGQPMKYDCDVNSAYNKQAKEEVERMLILDRKAHADAVELPVKFAELLSQNLSNCNVLHSKHAGYFKYFDGIMWVTKINPQVYEIISVWENKVQECFDLLGERHGDNWLGSFEAVFASNVIAKFKCRHNRTSCRGYLAIETRAKPRRAALLAVDNANSRIKAVESRTGKRVRRVFSKHEGEAHKRKVHKNVSWEELIN